jgi:hypothetical protein
LKGLSTAAQLARACFCPDAQCLGESLGRFHFGKSKEFARAVPELRSSGVTATAPWSFDYSGASEMFFEEHRIVQRKRERVFLD